MHCIRTLVSLSSSIFVIHSSQAVGATFDPPDLNLEYQMHRSFTVKAPQTSEDEQGRLETYRLQRGESLWGLSQMLYGDGSFWPKVWAQNRTITNPHLVRPGHTLQLLLGSEDEAPAFRFSEDGDSGVELAAASDTTGTEIEIPPPEVPPRPVIKIPTSFPHWQEVFRKAPDEMVIDDSKLRAKYASHPDRIIIDGYVQDAPLDSHGKFLENEKESGLPVPNQYVYVKIKKGQGRAGEKMLIVKDHGVLKSAHEEVDEEIFAHFIEVFGALELVEPAQASFDSSDDKKNFDVFRALILKSNGLALSDHDLIPGQIEYADLADVGPKGSVNAQLIGASKHKTSTLFGPGEIVFLNRGSKDGVQLGQILDIYMDRKIRDRNTPVGVSAYPSARVKVIRVDGSCATAVMVKTVDGIRQGDRMQGATSRLEPESSEAIDSGDSLDTIDAIDSEPETDEIPSQDGESTESDELSI